MFRRILVLTGVALTLSSCGLTSLDWNSAPRSGQLHLTRVDARAPVVTLDGKWDEFPGQLLESSPNLNPPTQQVTIPGSWNGKLGSSTLRMKVFAPESNPHFAMRMVDLTSAYRLFLNGSLIAHHDKVKEPYYLQVQATAPLRAGENEFMLQISEFESHQATILNSISLGPEEKVTLKRDAAFALDCSLIGLLAMTAFSHFSLFLLYRRDRFNLFFSLLCATEVIRLSTTSERVLCYFFSEVPWQTFQRIEFLTFYALGPLFYAFLTELYPDAFSKNVGRSWTYVSLAFAALTLFFPMSDTYAAAPFYRLIFLGYLVCVTWGTMKAFFLRCPGSRIVAAGLTVLGVSGINDVLFSQHLIHTGAISHIGLSVFILIHSFAISFRSSESYKESLTLTQELQTTNSAIQRFVPAPALKILKTEITKVSLGDCIEREIAILFCDIRKFTKLSSAMKPEENFAFINEYYGFVSPVVRNHNGYVDKYLGDGLLALFPGSADDAVHAALDMGLAVQKYNKLRVNRGQDPIEVGIGIHFGSLMLGIVGEESRIEVTVISDAVNVASRVESLTKIYGKSIIVTEQLIARLKFPFGKRLLDVTRLRGKETDQVVYEIFPIEDEEKKTA